MSRTNLARRTASAGALLLIALLTSLVAPASAQAKPAGADTRVCYVLLHKQTGTSEDLGCRLEPRATAGESVRPGASAEAASRPVSPRLATSTLLVQLFSNANYSGSVMSVSGDHGTCDAAGYGISNTLFFGARNLSSYDLFGACSKAALWEYCCIAAYGGAYSGVMIGDQASLPSFNDKAGSMKVYA